MAGAPRTGQSPVSSCYSSDRCSLHAGYTVQLGSAVGQRFTMKSKPRRESDRRALFTRFITGNTKSRFMVLAGSFLCAAQAQRRIGTHLIPARVNPMGFRRSWGESFGCNGIGELSNHPPQHDSVGWLSDRFSRALANFCY